MLSSLFYDPDLWVYGTWYSRATLPYTHKIPLPSVSHKRLLKFQAFLFESRYQNGVVADAPGCGHTASLPFAHTVILFVPAIVCLWTPRWNGSPKEHVLAALFFILTRRFVLELADQGEARGEPLQRADGIDYPAYPWPFVLSLRGEIRLCWEPRLMQSAMDAMSIEQSVS